MATATLPDHVYVIIEKQLPRFPAPGTYHWGIGMAYEAIKSGRCKIDPRSAKDFAEFEKAANAPRKIKSPVQEALSKEDAESRARMSREGVKRGPDGGFISPHEVRKNMI